MKLHLEGKTEQARADLARLAIIKKQREEAAKKREELRKGTYCGNDALTVLRQMSKEIIGWENNSMLLFFC